MHEGNAIKNILGGSRHAQRSLYVPEEAFFEIHSIVRDRSPVTDRL